MHESGESLNLPHLGPSFLSRFLEEESGQDLVEYALVAAMVALGSVAGTQNLAAGVANAFGGVQNTLNNAVPASTSSTPSSAAGNNGNGNPGRGNRGGRPGRGYGGNGGRGPRALN